MIFSSVDAKDLDAAFTVGKVITVDRSMNPIKIQVNLGSTHPATGEVDERFLLTHTGSVSFPDENNKKYNFWYYPAEHKIYWSADKGSTKDIWVGETDPSSKWFIYSLYYNSGEW